MCLSNNGARDGFGIILTLRHLNNNRFYANQTEGKERKKGCEKEKAFCFLLLCFCECKKERNPLRGIFAEMTVCIYQFFIRHKYYFRERVKGRKRR